MQESSSLHGKIKTQSLYLLVHIPTLTIIVQRHNTLLTAGTSELNHSNTERWNSRDHLPCTTGRGIYNRTEDEWQDTSAISAPTIPTSGGGQSPLTPRADGAYHIDFLIKIRDPQICLGFLTSIFTFRLRNLRMSNPEF
jgi:hypothetical protein